MCGVTKRWIEKLLSHYSVFNTPPLTAVKRTILVGVIITDGWERCDK
jgi:hypothetical protein